MGKIEQPTMSSQFVREDFARIQYQCRRGMLELDVFLKPYCDNCFLNLSAANQNLFVELLTEADPDLFNWLMGYGEATQKYHQVVELIRDYQHSIK